MSSRARVGIALGGVLLVAWLVLGPVGSMLEYRMRDTVDVDGVLMTGDAGGGRDVRGYVVPGSSSYVGKGNGCSHRFAIADDRPGATPIEVHYPRCVFPDAFHHADGLEVIVSGSLAREGWFAASHVDARIGGCCSGPDCYPASGGGS